MNKTLSFIFCQLFVGIILGQKAYEPEVTWGEEYKRPNSSWVNKIIHSDASGTYLWRDRDASFSSKEIIIEKYNSGLKLESSSVLPFRADSRNFNMVDIFHFNGQIVTLSALYDKGSDQNTLFFQTIDKQSLKLNDKKIEVAKISATKRYNKGGFDYAISRDSSKLLIFSEMPYSRSKEDKISMNVYDNNLQLLWKKDVELPYLDRNFEVENYEVSVNGDVYILGKITEQQAGLFNALEYHYVVIAYRNEGQDIKTYKVQLPDNFITEVTIRTTNNDDLICVGFYSERSTEGMKGAFYFKINAQTEQAYDIRKGAFQPAFLEQFMSKRRAKKGKAELYRYKLDQLILRSDGGVLIVAEQFYVRVVTRTDVNGFMTTTTTYHYNDIIAVNINPDGTIAWATRIPKYQSDGTGTFSSYAFMVNRGKLFFIYNDHPKNLTITDYRKIKNFNGKNSMVTLVTLSPNGMYTKDVLFSNRDFDIMTRPKISRQTNKDELVIFGTRNKNYKLGRVRF